MNLLFPVFEPSKDLWEPQSRGLLETIDLIEKGKRVVVQGPTGSGKTRLASELFRYAETMKFGANFYVNRKFLIGQTYNAFKDRGLDVAVRAAEYEDKFNISCRNQITSIATERFRVWRDQTWNLHPSKLIIVDEAHIQKSITMRKTLDYYRQEGAAIVLLTATPINMGNWADELVITGSLKEYRKCKAVVVAECKCISQPDMRKVKRNASGEYTMDGEKKRIFVQTIVGDVVKKWKEFNPDARATMLYAPGVPESRFFVDEFDKVGGKFVHIDSTEFYRAGKGSNRLTRQAWQDIMGEYRDGRIHGLSCRFKLREGIDAPWTHHAILATPIGSLASYIQTVGRALRYSEQTPERVLVTDHGGNVWRHGSPNHDKDWHILWKKTEHIASEYNMRMVQEAKRPESIVCPECSTERQFGSKCPSCGFEHPKSVRKVLMEDGTFQTIDGELIKRRRKPRKQEGDEKLWVGLFWGCRKSKSTRPMTFRQLEGFFFKKHHRYPSRELPFMPKNDNDFGENVRTISLNKLRDKE